MSRLLDHVVVVDVLLLGQVFSSEEVNTNVVDDTEVKKVDDDVNDKKVDNEDDA